VNAISGLESPLSLSVENIEITKFLVEQKADVCHINALGRTVLHFAINMWQKNRLEVMEYLIQAGAPIDKGEPILQAARRDRLKHVQLLIEKGANFKVTDDQGDTLLLTAAHFGCLDVAAWVLEHNYGTLTETNKHGDNVFLAAASGYDSKNVIEWLWNKYGAKYFLESRNKRGNTVLLEASRNLQVVKFLLHKGIPWNQKNTKHDNLLTIWESNSYYDHIKVIRWLVQHRPEITDSDIQEALQKCKKSKTWLVLVYHCEWKRIRLLWIGSKDERSVLSMLPEELIQCIGVFYKNSILKSGGFRKKMNSRGRPKSM